ncbi:hypothetical protein [Roseovarius sp.]|uniref:hypothetical protein n=1 Tax=Roseovarius sp. TaxID=1486281 RepID=UPI003A97E332
MKKAITAAFVSLSFLSSPALAIPLIYDEARDGDIEQCGCVPFPEYPLDFGINVVRGSLYSADKNPHDPGRVDFDLISASVPMMSAISTVSVALARRAEDTAPGSAASSFIISGSSNGEAITYVGRSIRAGQSLVFKVNSKVDIFSSIGFRSISTFGSAFDYEIAITLIHEKDVPVPPVPLPAPLFFLISSISVLLVSSLHREAFSTIKMMCRAGEADSRSL